MTEPRDAMQNERSAFEAWYEADAMPCEADWFKRDADAPDEYDSAHTQVAWKAWCAALEAREEPVDMLLFCPDCGEQHIDAPDPSPQFASPDDVWTNPPHKSHLCHGCGCIWRPANVPTNGVACGITRGKADTWLLGDGAIPTAPASLEALIRACYDDAALYPEMGDPRTGDWMYDDNSDCAEAIRKRGEETAREYIARLAASPAAAPVEAREPVAWYTKSGFYGHRDEIPASDLPPLGNPVPLYASPVAAAPQDARMLWLAQVRDDFRRMADEASKVLSEHCRNVLAASRGEVPCLSDERISAIADSMPGGLEGFTKGWGWNQFARAIEAAIGAESEQATEDGRHG